MTVTGELRRMLNERGVEWYERDIKTVYMVDERAFAAFEYDGLLNVWWLYGSYRCTPEQAIEATLGRGECVADETDTIKCVAADGSHLTVHVMECSACGHTYEHVNGDYEYCPHCGRRVSE